MKLIKVEPPDNFKSYLEVMFDIGWKENTKHSVLRRHRLVLLRDGFHLSNEPQCVVIMRSLKTMHESKLSLTLFLFYFHLEHNLVMARNEASLKLDQLNIFDHWLHLLEDLRTGNK